MSYAKLEQRFVQLHHLAHLGAICGWDRATMMPAGGNEARAAALAELSLLMHQKMTAPEMSDWFAAAAEEPLPPPTADQPARDAPPVATGDRAARGAGSGQVAGRLAL